MTRMANRRERLPETWKRYALCRGLDTNLFFPESGRPQPWMKDLKRRCRVCPVQEECLAYGLFERFGIWGGLSEAERRKVQRSWKLFEQEK